MFKSKVVDLGSPSYFVLTAAVELGFFEEEGVPAARVEGSMTGPDEIKAGTVDFIGGPAYAGLRAFPSFQGAKLLCALSQYSYWFLGVRASLGVKRGDVGALRGLRISSGSGEPRRSLLHLLKQSGIDVDGGEVQVVNSPSFGRNQTFRANDGVAALQQGISDAFWGNGLRMEMGVRSGLAKVHVDLRRGDGPPDARWYNFPALLASDRLIDEKPEVAAGAVRAIVRTQQALIADPSLAGKVGRAMFPSEEAELIATVVERDTPFYDAHVSREAVDGLNKFCVAAGLLPEPVPYDRMVATQFAPLWTVDRAPGKAENRLQPGSP
jgi:ABC-type nitrate/sulfonate/bicarbonate transport system substrate-binding protein